MQSWYDDRTRHLLQAFDDAWATRDRPLEAVRTHPAVLADAYQSPANHRYVARNWSTPRSILANLARSANTNVRCAVAENPNTPTAALRLLATDTTTVVRSRVASNPSTPDQLHHELCSDLSTWVANTARAGHHNLYGTHAFQIRNAIVAHANDLSEAAATLIGALYETTPTITVDQLLAAATAVTADPELSGAATVTPAGA